MNRCAVVLYYAPDLDFFFNSQFVGKRKMGQFSLGQAQLE